MSVQDENDDLRALVKQLSDRVKELEGQLETFDGQPKDLKLTPGRGYMGITLGIGESVHIGHELIEIIYKGNRGAKAIAVVVRAPKDLLVKRWPAAQNKKHGT